MATWGGIICLLRLCFGRRRSWRWSRRGSSHELLELVDQDGAGNSGDATKDSEGNVGIDGILLLLDELPLRHGGLAGLVLESQGLLHLLVVSLDVFDLLQGIFESFVEIFGALVDVLRGSDDGLQIDLGLLPELRFSK